METKKNLQLVVDNVNLYPETYHIDKTEFTTFKVIVSMDDTCVKFDIDTRYISTIKYLVKNVKDFEKNLKMLITQKEFYDVKKDRCFTYYEFKIFDNKYLNCNIKPTYKDKNLYKLLINDYITWLSK